MSRLDARLWHVLLARAPQPDRASGMIGPHDVALADVEQLGGLLYRRLLGLGTPPQIDTADLAHEYHETAAENLSILRELAVVLGRLGGQAGHVLVLPGAALLRFYPDLGCRPMDDVDLLVAPGQGEAVRQGLREAGLRSPYRHPDLLVGNRLTIDLHEQALNEDRVPSRSRAGTMSSAALWEASRCVELDGLRVRVAGPEDEFIYSAAHAVRHGYSRLVWLVDLSFLQQTMLDWELLRARARHHGLTRPVLYALHLLRRELGGRLPGDVVRWLESEPLGRVEQVLLRRAFTDGSEGEWGDLLWSCGVAERRARRRFLVETAFPRAEVLLQVFPFLPRQLAPLAYVLRVFQLVIRAGRLGARVLRRLGR